MRRLITLSLASTLLAVSLSSPAQSAYFTGKYLLQVCSTNENGKERAPGSHIACQAYLAGLIDYYKVVVAMGAEPDVLFCIPEGEGLTKVQQTIVRFLSENSAEQKSFVAAPSAAIALSSAYPCKTVEKAPVILDGGATSAVQKRLNMRSDK